MSLKTVSVFLMAGLCLLGSIWAGEGMHPIHFRNVAEGSGVDFVLDNYMTEEKHMIETMPGGVATLD